MLVGETTSWARNHEIFVLRGTDATKIRGMPSWAARTLPRQTPAVWLSALLARVQIRSRAQISPRPYWGDECP